MLRITLQPLWRIGLDDGQAKLPVPDEVQDAIRAYQGDISKQLGLIVNAAALESVNDVNAGMALVVIKFACGHSFFSGIGKAKNLVIKI